jgi:2-oxoglutarate dehydrogenase E2 component (dihydrolipoamide succinyltransferase)
MFEIKVPAFGESIQEVQVANWLKQPGDWVERDEEIVELESEKASQSLTADKAGVLAEIKVQTGQFAQIGDVLCLLDDAAVAVGAPAEAVAHTSQQIAGAAIAGSDHQPKSASWVMPAAERVLSEYQISADAITPTGPGGRLLKEDVLNYIEKNGLKPAGVAQSKGDPGTAAVAVAKPAAPAEKSVPVSKATEKPAQPAPAVSPKDSWGEFSTAPSRDEKAVPMSMIRRTIAKRLVEAQQTAALLTTFNEIDMQPVKELRSRYQNAFQEKHGVKLGFMSFFAKAAVEGLRRFPAINAEIRGNDVIMKNYHDIGVAIGGGKGLVVPILRNVERMSFADVERTIGRFAVLAQDNKIQPEDLIGGTFTISNGGVYGSLLSTPIVNPPQSGILGLHSIQDRPIALNGQVVIRPMMYIALTYDHRIVDGREAVGFLKTIKEVLEEPARLFLEV